MQENQTQDAPKPKLTEKELFDQLKVLYQHQLSIDEDIAALKKDGKEAELRVTAIATLAKADAAETVDTLETKANLTLELINELI